MGRLLEGEWGEALLPEYVFLEVATVLARRRSLGTAVAVCETLLQAREVEFVPCSGIFLDAFSVFRVQQSRGLSFADAAIVAVARRRNAAFIATFDLGFVGLEALTVVPRQRPG